MPPRRRPPDIFARLNRSRGRRLSVDGVSPLAAAEEAYAHNIFVSTALRRLEQVTLDSFEDTEFAQGWALAEKCPRCANDRDGLQGDHIRRHLRRWLAAHGAPRRVRAPAAALAANLRFIARLLGLSKDEAAVFRFLVTLHRSNRLASVAHCLGDLALPDALKVVAAATRLSFERVAACFVAEARLVRSGVVLVAAEAHALPLKLSLKSEIVDLVARPSLDRQTFVRAFLEPAARATLSRSDFADQGSVTTACALVGAAVRTGARGVNVLLHGPTGVGKSELARLIGQELGLEVLAVGRADANGESASPEERLASLRLALQLAPRGQSVLLFDELEDLFRWDGGGMFGPSRAAPQMSKQWFAALLEENELPVLWCTNQVEGIDPAFLRRFAYAVELKAPGAAQRARVLSHHLGPDAALAPAEVEAVAGRFEACPAQLATAVRGARLLADGGAPDRATIERLLAPVHKLLTGVDAAQKPVFEPGAYRLDALRCGEDLEALAAEVARFEPGVGPGVSLCLYGPPGTGKSEFVKYLAWRCGRPLVFRRASDLLSPWVGVTERKLAAAFEEARHEGAVLCFDEADSFLRDRASARTTWEVTQVNEFLQQLEAFPGIVACTTNLWRDVDEAALRRFVFKLEFRHPDAAQAAALFRAFFPEAAAAAGEPAVLAAVRGLPRLSPGDFAAVARRVRAVRGAPGFERLVALLAAEVGVKREAPRAVGFQG